MIMISFKTETKVEFDPTTFQQMAGLVCFYNTGNWTYLYISHDEEKKLKSQMM